MSGRHQTQSFQRTLPPNSRSDPPKKCRFEHLMRQANVRNEILSYLGPIDCGHLRRAKKIVRQDYCPDGVFFRVLRISPRRAVPEQGFTPFHHLCKGSLWDPGPHCKDLRILFDPSKSTDFDKVFLVPDARLSFLPMTDENWDQVLGHLRAVTTITLRTPYRSLKAIAQPSPNTAGFDTLLGPFCLSFGRVTSFKRLTTLRLAPFHATYLKSLCELTPTHTESSRKAGTAWELIRELECQIYVQQDDGSCTIQPLDAIRSLHWWLRGFTKTLTTLKFHWIGDVEGRHPHPLVLEIYCTQAVEKSLEWQRLTTLYTGNAERIPLDMAGLFTRRMPRLQQNWYLKNAKGLSNSALDFTIDDSTSEEWHLIPVRKMSSGSFDLQERNLERGYVERPTRQSRGRSPPLVIPRKYVAAEYSNHPGEGRRIHETPSYFPLSSSRPPQSKTSRPRASRTRSRRDIAAGPFSQQFPLDSSRSHQLGGRYSEDEEAHGRSRAHSGSEQSLQIDPTSIIRKRRNESIEEQSIREGYEYGGYVTDLEHMSQHLSLMSPVEQFFDESRGSGNGNNQSSRKYDTDISADDYYDCIESPSSPSGQPRAETQQSSRPSEEHSRGRAPLVHPQQWDLGSSDPPRRNDNYSMKHLLEVAASMDSAVTSTESEANRDKVRRFLQGLQFSDVRQRSSSFDSHRSISPAKRQMSEPIHHVPSGEYQPPDHPRRIVSLGPSVPVNGTNIGVRSRIPRPRHLPKTSQVPSSHPEIKDTVRKRQSEQSQSTYSGSRTTSRPSRPNSSGMRHPGRDTIHEYDDGLSETPDQNPRPSPIQVGDGASIWTERTNYNFRPMSPQPQPNPSSTEITSPTNKSRLFGLKRGSTSTPGQDGKRNSASTTGNGEKEGKRASARVAIGKTGKKIFKGVDKVLDHMAEKGQNM